MRIGIEAQRLFRPNKHGMDIVALESICHLLQQQSEHTFVVFVRPGDDPCLPSHPALEVRPVKGGTYPIWEQVALPWAVQAADIDLLHCTSNTAPMWLDVPLVLTLHDVIFLEEEREGTGSWYQQLGNLYRRWVVPPAARRAEAVVTVSNHERRRIAERLPAIADRLTVVPNAVSSHFRPVTDERTCEAVQGRYNLPDDFLFFLGNTDPKKNLRRVVAAYAQYAATTEAPSALVVADYEQHRLQHHLDAIGHPEVGAHIRCPGYIDHDDLPVVYSLATAFLYPSLRESFGLPILEAMACDTPVVTANVAAMPEVGGTAALQVDPHDVDDIADGIRTVAERPERRRTLIQRGRERVDLFSWDQTAHSLLSVYESVGKASAAGTVQRSSSDGQQGAPRSCS